MARKIKVADLFCGAGDGARDVEESPIPTITTAPSWRAMPVIFISIARPAPAGR
jgi:hypothetical protein